MFKKSVIYKGKDFSQERYGYFVTWLYILGTFTSYQCILLTLMIPLFDAIFLILHVSLRVGNVFKLSQS